MTATLSPSGYDVELECAAQRLYDAEIALHIAHQTGVDAWINAAADRLHQAIVTHQALRRRRSGQ